MGKANLDPDFKEFLKLLNSEKVEYLVLGGLAVSFHGHPRFTGDMDIWISNSPENTRRLSAALQGFGFNPRTVPPEKFQEPESVFQFGRPPLRIDLLTAPSGIKFE